MARAEMRVNLSHCGRHCASQLFLLSRSHLTPHPMQMPYAGQSRAAAAPTRLCETAKYRHLQRLMLLRTIHLDKTSPIPPSLATRYRGTIFPNLDERRRYRTTPRLDFATTRHAGSLSVWTLGRWPKKLNVCFSMPASRRHGGGPGREACGSM